MSSDDELLTRAEEALTEIKVAHGLSEAHEAVLAALRIRLKGAADASLEDLLAATEDAPATGDALDRLLAEPPSAPEWPTG